MPTHAEKRRLHEEIEEARQRNALYSVPGTLRLQTQYHYRDKAAPSKRWRRLPGFRNVSVCSGAKKWKVLSPVYLGPIKLDNLEAQSLENAWFYSQVFKDDVIQDHIVDDWFARRVQGFALPAGIAQKRGKSLGKPLFYYIHDQRLNELEARKIFCTIYAEHVQKLDEFQELRILLKQGYNLQLFGYDCYDFIADHKTINDCLQDVDSKFGHEFVLWGLLNDHEFWKS